MVKVIQDLYIIDKTPDEFKQALALTNKYEFKEVFLH
jgi:hypothetical protein